MRHLGHWRIAASRRGVTAALALLLSACGGGGGGNGDEPLQQDPLPQVSRSTEPYAPIDPSFYAASRFLEHASFGPTPTSVAALADGRFSDWIEAQKALPASKVDATSVRNTGFDNPAQFLFLPIEFHRLALTAPDQLRLRVSYALSQIHVVSQSRASGWSVAQYYNMLQDRAFGSYRDLLRAVTLHATMGFYQDNAQNRRAGAWPGATPNENYARELMQLFSIGLVLLNPDGTQRLGPDGQPIATYDQAQVESLARALTGWSFDVQPGRPSDTDFGNFASPMVATDFAHDFGEKRIVGGRTISAGGNPAADLEAILDILMAHTNLAPFVVYRLIQHLVTGDPTPAYVQRIAAVFRATDGDLGAVVRALLLDPEARTGDRIGAPLALRGKIREPVLGRIQLFRAFGCQRAPGSEINPTGIWAPGQTPFNARTVFNFFTPQHRIPGTTLVAPESKLLSATLLQARANEMTSRFWGPRSGEAGWLAAGCDASALDAASTDAQQAAELISRRLLRGAMPVYLRDAIAVGVFSRNWDPSSRAYDAVGLTLISPAWGVMK